MALVTAVVDRRRWSHDVSILIAAGAGGGRCFGSQPRSKVSMTIMRPPQHGHGRGSTRGSSIAALGVSGSFAGGGTASSSRAWRNVFGAIAAGEQPIVADAVEALRQHVDEEAPDTHKFHWASGLRREAGGIETSSTHGNRSGSFRFCRSVFC